MSSQAETQAEFLNLVYASLQKSAREAARIAQFTGTKLVSIDSAEPMIPEAMKAFLHALHDNPAVGSDAGTV